MVDTIAKVLVKRRTHIPGRRKQLEEENTMVAAAMVVPDGSNHMDSVERWIQNHAQHRNDWKIILISHIAITNFELKIIIQQLAKLQPSQKLF